MERNKKFVIKHSSYKIKLIKKFKKIIKLNFYKFDFINIQQKKYMLKNIKFNKNSNFIYILIDRKIIGFCEYYVKNLNIIFIKKIYILPSYQNRGIGSIIFYYLLNIFNEKKLKIFLYVNKNNFQALKFYGKLKFSKKRSLKKYIGNNFFMNDYLLLLKINNLKIYKNRLKRKTNETKHILFKKFPTKR